MGVNRFVLVGMGVSEGEEWFMRIFIGIIFVFKFTFFN